MASYGGARLPPIGYAPTTYPQAPPVSLGGEYANNYIATGSYNPSSPYAQSHQQVYGQSKYIAATFLIGLPPCALLTSVQPTVVNLATDTAGCCCGSPADAGMLDMRMARPMTTGDPAGF